MAKPATADANAVKRPKGKPGDKRGAPQGQFKNPPFKPTDEQRLKVEVYSGAGWTRPMIAAEILGRGGKPISEDTLTRHFADELAAGDARVTARIGSTVAQQALDGCRKSQRLYLDRRGGDPWKPKTGLELSGPGGAPIQHEDMSKPSDFSKLPVDKRRMLETLLAEAAEAQQGDEQA